jgi:S-adenosylmethionine synthetase
MVTSFFCGVLTPFTYTKVVHVGDQLAASATQEVYVHVAYAIGVADPLMAVVTVDGVQENITGYDLRPKAIIEFLDLRKPQFRVTSQYGHFGNGFTWDK